VISYYRRFDLEFSRKIPIYISVSKEKSLFLFFLSTHLINQYLPCPMQSSEICKEKNYGNI